MLPIAPNLFISSALKSNRINTRRAQKPFLPIFSNTNYDAIVLPCLSFYWSHTITQLTPWRSLLINITINIIVDITAIRVQRPL